MKIVLTQAGNFTYLAELRPLETPKGAYHLSFQSTWGGAKDPDGVRKLFHVTTDAPGIKALQTLLAGAVGGEI